MAGRLRMLGSALVCGCRGSVDRVINGMDAGGCNMTRLVLFFLISLALLRPTAAGEPWSGNWQVKWPGGGGLLILEQQGSAVRGSYQNGRVRIEANAEENQLAGLIILDNGSETFSATLSAAAESFSGHTDAGSWLSGRRLTAAATRGSSFALDLHSPRATMRSFLRAANLAQEGEKPALAWAVDTIDFDKAPGLASQEDRFHAAEQLFRAIDLATFNLSSIPEQDASSPLRLSFPRLDTAATIDLDMVRSEDGNWRIVMPAAEALRAMAASATPRPADAFRQLQSPRDTLRTFLEGMKTWDRGGDAQAIATIDLSHVADVLKSEQGRLTSQYLIRIIDRVGHMPLQSIPNSGLSREPFVYFEHPEGRILVEPIGTGEATRWKFSAETVQNARSLFSAVQHLPEVHTLDPAFIPASPVFTLRQQVKTYAPALLGDVLGRGRVEYWQVLGALLIVGGAIALSLLFRSAGVWLLMRPSLKHHVAHPRRLAAGASVGLAFVLAAEVIPSLGLPASMRQFTLPVLGSLVLVAFMYAAWQAVALLSSVLQGYAERTETQFDNILITFGAGVARLTVVAVTGLVIGHLWSVPTTGLLAGLGLGGLAIAIASKETLSNVFGAGVLLGDRPFRTGDRIIAGDINGWVEAVGIRSTRIRTLSDSLLIVPNGKLTELTINNLGARRRRTFSTTLLVTSGSTPEKLRSFTEAISNRISSDPIYDPSVTEVHITGIVAEGVRVEISTALNTRSGTAFRKETNDLLLDILRLAESQGLSLVRRFERHPAYDLKEA
jgi:MscS family membrane protein